MRGTLGKTSGRHSLLRLFSGLRPADGLPLLAVLLSADTAFIVLHTLHKLTPLFADAAFALDTESGYPEIFQYVKFAALVAMLAKLWSRTRESLYGAWMLLLTYALCDDAFQVHERAGSLIAEAWRFRNAFGLRAGDFGELMVTGLAGTLMISLIILLRSRSGRFAKADSRSLTILIAGLGFFGVFMDMVHVVVDGYVRYVGGAVGIVEDGGEMVVVSVMCWYVSTLLPRRGIARLRREDRIHGPAFPGPQILPNVPRPL